MSGPIARGLPSVFTRQQFNFSANRGRSSPSNVAWGSGANDGQSAKPILDPQAEEAGEESPPKLPWMQKISSDSIRSPTTRKPSNHPYRRR